MQPISIQPTAISTQLQQPQQLQQMASIELIEPNNTAVQQQEPILIGSPHQNVQSPQQQPIHFEQALRYLNKIKVANYFWGIISNLFNCRNDFQINQRFISNLWPFSSIINVQMEAKFVPLLSNLLYLIDIFRN